MLRSMLIGRRSLAVSTQLPMTGKFAVPQPKKALPPPEFAYKELFQKDGSKPAQWDRLDEASKYVSTYRVPGETEDRLKIQPEALTLLCERAMKDVAHLLRPSHLAQLSSILEDVEAS